MGNTLYHNGAAINPQNDYNAVINPDTNATLKEDLKDLKDSIGGNVVNWGEGGVTAPSSSVTTLGGTLLTEAKTLDITKDFYIEAVCKPIDGSQKLIFQVRAHSSSTGSYCYLRCHNGGLQFCISYGSGSLTNQYNNCSVLKDSFKHIICVKKDNIAYTYVDGVLAGQTAITAVQNISSASMFMVTIGACTSVKMARCGYIDDDVTVGELVTKHFNGNNPFSVDTTDEDMLVDMQPSDITTTSLTNMATGLSVTFATPSGVEKCTENKWANPLTGSGSPTNAPIYIGQTYKNTTSGKVYSAVGRTSVNDWTYDADSKDLASLKTEIVAYGNQHWSGGSGGSSANVVMVDGVGDGATDDTQAIMTALELARSTGKALYFPKGTWLTRKGLVLTSNMIVTSAMGATLKSASAVLNGSGRTLQTTLSAAASVGDTTITVNNTAGMVVGQEITIWASGSYTETKADITAVNGNVLTIDTSRFTADGSNDGCINAYASGSYVLTDFALIETYFTKAAENILIENITLEPCSLMTEPHIYTISPISQTKQMNGVPQKNFIVRNVTVMESAHDGISVQGSGEIEVIGCRVFGQKHKGIHWGTSCDMVKVMNNYVYGCGSSQYESFADYQGSGAMFFCSNNHRVIITGNHIENCYKGIYGFNYQGNGERDTDSIIANNTFKNCTLYGLMLRGGDRVIVNGNNFLGFKGSSTPIYVESDSGYPLNHSVITGNTIGAFDANHSGVAINVVSATNTIVANNVCEKGITVADGLTNVLKVNNIEG